MYGVRCDVHSIEIQVSSFTETCSCQYITEKRILENISSSAPPREWKMTKWESAQPPKALVPQYHLAGWNIVSMIRDAETFTTHLQCMDEFGAFEVVMHIYISNLLISIGNEGALCGRKAAQSIARVIKVRTPIESHRILMSIYIYLHTHSSSRYHIFSGLLHQAHFGGLSIRPPLGYWQQKMM